MDYTRKGQSVYEPKDFFTSGVGDIPANQNTFESENNLDLTNNQTSWDQGEIRQNVRSIGNTAISTPEVLKSGEQDYLEYQPHEMVEVIAPPNMEPSDAIIKDAISAVHFDPKLIRTDGDRIGKTALTEVDNVIQGLNQTGDAADFYATVRGDNNHPGMVRANLKNSYNREVA